MADLARSQLPLSLSWRVLVLCAFLWLLAIPGYATRTDGRSLLTTPTASISDPTAGAANVEFAISFTLESALDADGAIAVGMPATYAIPAAITATSAALDGTLTATADAQTVTVTRSGAATAVPASTAVALMLAGFTNPPISGPTGSFTLLETLDSQGGVVEAVAAGDLPAGPTLDPGAFSDTAASVAPATAGAEGAALTLRFTLGNALPGDGQIVVGLPAELAVEAGVAASSGTIDGALTATSTAGHTVTVTRTPASGPTLVPAGTAVDLILTGITNPAVSGETSAFTSLWTTNAADTYAIDEASALHNAAQLPGGLAIVPGVLASPAPVVVAPSDTTAGAAALALSIAFTTRNAWGAADALRIAFPAAVALDAGAALAVTAQSCDGALAAAVDVAGGVLTLTRSGGTAVAAGAAVSIAVAGGFANPRVSGATGAFAAFETVAAANGRVIDAAPAGTVLGWTVTAAGYAAPAPSVTLSNYAAGAASTATLSFTPALPLPADGRVVVAFPAGFAAAAAGALTVTAVTGLAGGETLSSSVSVVDGALVATLTRGGGGGASVGAITLTLAGLRNPAVSGATAAFAYLETQTTGGAAICSAAATPAGVAIVAGSLPGLPTVTPSDAVAGTAGLSMMVAFVTNNAWASGAALVIQFPAAVAVGPSAALSLVAPSFDGAATVASAGSTVTVTRTSGADVEGGGAAVSFTLAGGFTNPGVAGATGSFGAFRLVSADNLDIDVTAQAPAGWTVVAAGFAAPAPSVTLSSYAAGAAATATLTFTPALPLLADGRVVLALPPGFAAAALTVRAAAGLAADEALTATLDASGGGGVVATLARGGTGGASSGAIVLTIAGLSNPTVSGVTAPFGSLTMQTASGGTMCAAAAVPAAVTIVAGRFPAVPIAAVSSTTAGATGLSVTVTFATNNAWASGASLLLQFPTSVAVGASAALSLAARSFDGAAAVASAGASVTVTRTSGTPVAAGGSTVTLTLDGGFANPSFAGATGALPAFKLVSASGADIDAAPADALPAGWTVAAAGFVQLAPSVTLSDYAAGAAGPATLSFTPALALPADGRVVVTFPPGFTASALTARGAAGLAAGETLSSALSTVDGALVATLTRGGTGGTSSGAVVVTIAGLVNPSVSGATAAFGSLATQTAGGDVMCSAASVPAALAIVAGSLPGVPTVTPSSTVAGAANLSVTVAFTTNNAWASGSALVLEFPASVTVGAAAALSLSAPSFDGAASVSASGRRVTVRRSGGTAVAAGGAAVSFTLVGGFTNPSAAGATGALVYFALVSSGDAVIDVAAAAPLGWTVTAAGYAAPAPSVTLSDYAAGAASTATLSFTPAVPLPADGRVVMAFPRGFAVPSTLTVIAASGLAVGESLAASLSTVDGALVAALSRAGAGGASSGAISLVIAGLANPAVSGATAAFGSLVTQTASGDVMCSALSTPAAVAIVAGSLPGVPTVTPSSVVAGASGLSLAVAFATNNAWVSGAALVLQLPAGVAVDASAALAVAGASFDGAVAVSSSGSTVTVRRTSGSAVAGGGAAVSFTLSGGFKNPGVAGSTGALPVFKLVSADNLDIDTTGAALPAGWTVAPGAFGVTPALTLSSAVAAATLVDVTIALVLGNALPVDGVVAFTFPAGFALSGIASAPARAAGLDGSMMVAHDGQTVRVARAGDGSAAPAGAAVFVTVAGVANPAATGATGAFTAVTTLTAAGAAIDDAAAHAQLPPGVTLTPASFASPAPAIALDDAYAGATGVVATLTFTPAIALPAGGSVVVTFPAGFTAAVLTAMLTAGVGAAETLAAAIVTGSDGALTMTATRPGTGAASSGALTLALAGLSNPGVSGATGAFPLLRTRNGAGATLCEAAATGGANALATPASVAIAAAPFAAAALALAPLTIGATASAAVSLTLAAPLPAGGAVWIAFPAQFAAGLNALGAAAVAPYSTEVLSAAATTAGGAVVAVSGWAVPYPSGTVLSFTVTGIVNPPVVAAVTFPYVQTLRAAAGGAAIAYRAAFATVALSGAGVTLSHASLAVTEGDAAGAAYTIVLAAAPAAAVTVTVTAATAAVVTVAPSAVTFSTSTWATPQAVRVVAVDDAAVQATTAVALVHAVTSADAAYAAAGAAAWLPSDTVIAYKYDNDDNVVTLSTADIYLDEGAQTAYTVALTGQPSANVVVTLRVSDAALLTVFPLALTFTPAAWAAPQTVSVAAVDDGVAAATSSYGATIAHAAASADAAFDGAAFAPAAAVAVTIYDNDAGCYRSCPAGSHSATCAGALLCTPCAPGYWCVGGCASPAACPTGTFRTDPGAAALGDCAACAAGSYAAAAGAATCALCPAGYKCASSAAAPAACPVGTYSGAGATACSTCPDGYYAAAEGQTACTECPAGHMCANKSQAPAACAPGTYATAGALTCTDCPQGYYCSSTGDAPQLCPAGTYSLPNGAYCISCPPGYFCLNAAGIPEKCPVGYASVGGAATCVQCAVGTYADVAGAVTCTACPSGRTCLDPTLSPVLCPAGHACATAAQPDGTYAIEVACAAGTYAVAGQTSCSPCPAGYACTVQGVITACTPGTYSGGLQTECTICPAGYRCTSTTAVNNPVACVAGTYALAGQTSCATCPPGYSCTTDGTVAACLAGTYSLAGQADCTACAAGYYCASTTSSTAVPCVAGSLSVGGATSCTQCPAGYACPSASTNQMNLCAAGEASALGSSSCYTCSAGTYSAVGSSTCQTCPAGTYSAASSSACTVCAAGYVSAGGAGSCAACAPGTYSSAGATACTTCPAGYSCGSATAQPALCAPGTYCAQGTGASAAACPAGTYGTQWGAASAAAGCVACTEGYYCSGTGGIGATQACPAGHYCPPQSATPIQCPAGTYSTATGQWSSATCLTCPPGLWCNYGSTAGVACPAGYYCQGGTGSAAAASPCPAGTYSSSTGLTNASQCIACPAGYYCLQGATAPTLCATGKYNPTAGGGAATACLLCVAGWACPSTGMTAMTQLCAAGHYCPAGTASPSQYPCPAGTYSDATDIVSAAQCAQCPARFTCAAGATTATLVTCPAGYYCPAGSAVAAPCAPGTWSARTALAAAAECDACTQGYYCTGGAAAPAACAKGYYCPLGSSSATGHACPAGTYSASTSIYLVGQCTTCPTGSYCPQASTAPLPCPGGYYADATGSALCTQQCPAGAYCPAASSAATPCDVGHYSSAGASACTRCPAGYYCSATGTSSTAMLTGGAAWSRVGDAAGACFNGTLCVAADDADYGYARAPDLLRDPCPVGHYCPAGAPAALPCPAGTLQPLVGMDGPEDCQDTPAGYYSIAASTRASLCEPGYYCPINSTGPRETPCPARFYRSDWGAASEADCSLCTSGGYCPGGGNAAPIVCPAGFYCITGSDQPQPCPLGTYSPTTGLRRIDDCIECDAGSYCDQTGLTAPAGPCDPGYYCISGSETPAPYAPGSPTTSSVVGSICPAGGYCVEGSTYPAPCPQGTFNTVEGRSSPDECVDCTPGYYCEGTNNPSVSGPCWAGYYCDGGAKNAVQHRTPAGTYTIAGSEAPIPCPKGTYNLETGQPSCVGAPAGYYAPELGTVNLTVCAAGTYCPGNSSYPELCPAGTYNTQVGRTNITDCLPAVPGYYIGSNGMTASTGPCDAGYYCTAGSYLRNPVGLTGIGDLCPAGHYCPQATGTPFACPIGTYLPSTGSDSIQDCIVCTPGYYCGTEGLAAPTGQCSAGYYCQSGVAVAAPTTGIYTTTYTAGGGAYTSSGAGYTYGGAICPAGYYCPARSLLPAACVDGTYAPTTGAAACTPCLAAFACAGTATITPVACAAGRYCPAGTGAAAPACAVGTYGGATGLAAASDCAACTAGSYCATAGLTAPTGLCAAGYYCPSGSQSSIGKTSTATSNICPKGYYCPAGASTPTACPPGTYAPGTGMTSLNGCTVCSVGNYCETAGLTAPTGKCSAGYYCKSGVATAAPTGGTYTTTYTAAGGYTSTGLTYGGDICPAGSYCLSGVSAPALCSAGSYSAAGETTAACRVCEAGYLCPIGTAA